MSRFCTLLSNHQKRIVSEHSGRHVQYTGSLLFATSQCDHATSTSDTHKTSQVGLSERSLSESILNLRRSRCLIQSVQCTFTALLSKNYVNLIGPLENLNLNKITYSPIPWGGAQTHLCDFSLLIAACVQWTFHGV